MMMALLERALAESLNQFQDEFVDDLHSAWPPLGAGDLALPGTAVTEGLLHGWYGERDCPLLALRPIDPLAQPRGAATT